MTDTITCPRCGLTSHDPTDIVEGYCGHCHDWTSRGHRVGPIGPFTGAATITLPADNDVDGEAHTSAPPAIPPREGRTP